MEEIGGHQQPVEIYEIGVDFKENGEVGKITIPIPESRKNTPAFAGLDNVSLDWEKIQELAKEFKSV